ncbi:MAG: 6-hydroxymethylpterin diphosphokinase MptE-like protein [Anaerocolumna sp.]
MDNKIKEVYFLNIQLLGQMDKLIYYFRIQNFDYALRLSGLVLQQLDHYTELLNECNEYFNEEEEVITPHSFLYITQELFKALEMNDYILLSDYYELLLMPLLLKLQEIIIKKERYCFNQELYNQNINYLESKDKSLTDKVRQLPSISDSCQGHYELEFTTSGLMTLAINEDNKKYYFHSNNRPDHEAMLLAHSWYEEDKRTYIVYGLGLGYHIYELYAMDNNVVIEVYESDLKIIQLACTLPVMKSILSADNIKLCYDPNFVLLKYKLMNIEKNSEFVIHYPSLRNIKNYTEKEKLESYFIQYSSVKNQLHLLNGNFYSNIENYDTSADQLRNIFREKDLYIVAAGPSLDKNYMQLKEVSAKGIILSTGTVLRKLVKAGITPDYVIVTDANQRVYGQIAGLEDLGIPMLFLSTAYKGFAQNYQGSKYIILQKDYPNAEKFAHQNGMELFCTGGSVSTTALDLGIRLGCKKIIFLGLDLAFTDNYVHATATSKRDLAGTEGLKLIEDNKGNMIYTSRSLDIYRSWIENRIKGEKGIEFINATEGGAKIMGMRAARLSEVVS